MERAAIEINSIELSETKEAYLVANKGLSGSDIVEVWLNSPRYFVNFTGRGAPNAMLGPNRTGRFMLVALAPVDVQGTWRVVTAYWLRKARALKLYGEK